MSKLRVKFCPSPTIGEAGRIVYHILHERRMRQIETDLRIYPTEWDTCKSAVVSNPESERMVSVCSIRDQIRYDMERLTKIIQRFDCYGMVYTADDIVNEYHRLGREYTIFTFMETMVAEFRQNGKLRKSETYQTTLNSFRRFRHNADIMLDSVDSRVMEGYEAWNRQRGLAQNTISFYIRILRAVYNHAVEECIIDNRRPFRRVYTGIDKTVKRALPIRIIRKISTLDLSASPNLDYARDMFMLSFMLRGMSFIDMAYLQKSDFHDGRICYRRKKTGRQLSVEWTEAMQRITDKYPINETSYFLPIIHSNEGNVRNIYRNVGYNINHNLKTIARMIGLRMPLTLYVARHSWASIALEKGVPLSVISEGMGHDSETTTRIYLAELDNSVVDKANLRIIESLLRSDTDRYI